MSGVYESHGSDTTESFAAFTGVDLEHSAQPLDLYFIYSIANKDIPLALTVKQSLRSRPIFCHLYLQEVKLDAKMSDLHSSLAGFLPCEGIPAHRKASGE